MLIVDSKQQARAAIAEDIKRFVDNDAVEVLPYMPPKVDGWKKKQYTKRTVGRSQYPGMRKGYTRDDYASKANDTTKESKVIF